MFAAFTGQPLEVIQKYIERDRYFSAAEVTLLYFWWFAKQQVVTKWCNTPFQPFQAMDFGLIDGVLETLY